MSQLGGTATTACLVLPRRLSTPLLAPQLGAPDRVRGLLGALTRARRLAGYHVAAQ